MGECMHLCSTYLISPASQPVQQSVPQPVRKSFSAPDQTSSPQALPAAELSGEKAANPTATSVRSHKRRIADAVESMQERRKLFRKLAEPTGPVAGKRGVATPQVGHMTVMCLSHSFLTASCMLVTWYCVLYMWCPCTHTASNRRYRSSQSSNRSPAISVGLGSLREVYRNSPSLFLQ